VHLAHGLENDVRCVRDVAEVALVVERGRLEALGQRQHTPGVEINRTGQREHAIGANRIARDRIPRVEGQRRRAGQVGGVLQVARFADEKTG
jgi:hypothetical protein